MSSDRVIHRGTDPKQVVLIVAVSVALLLTVVWFLVRGGNGDREGAPPQTQPMSTSQSQEEPEPAEAKKPGSGPVETFEVFAPKDPFKPLVAQRNEGQGGSGDGSSGAQNAGGGAAGKNVDGHAVKLVDVFDEDGAPMAQVQVDSSVYTVSEGETFAENFQLLTVSGECASILYGDDQFTLCEGEEILK